MSKHITNKINSLSDPTDHTQLQQAIMELDDDFCRGGGRRFSGCTACIAIVTPVQSNNNTSNGEITPINNNDNTNNNDTSTSSTAHTSLSSNSNPNSNSTKRTKQLSNKRSFVSSTPVQQKQRYKVLFVNVGDSRAILIEPNGDFSFVTTDHKPDNPNESQRIRSAGGSVSFGRVDGELAMSRAIGDYSYKQNTKLPAQQQKVISLPDITELVADESDEILLCCDGLFEKLTTEQVAAFIHCAGELDDTRYKREPSRICSMLLDYSLAIGSKDNMSAMLIQFADGTLYQQENGELIAGSLENIDLDADQKYIDTYVDYAKIHLPSITFDTLRSMSLDTDAVRQNNLHQLDQLYADMKQWKQLQKKRDTWNHLDHDDDDEMII